MATAALALLAASATELSAQSPSLAVELSADSVALAEIFDLVVRVDVPPDRAVYFPDTVAASPDVESFAPVVWRAERSSAPPGGATVTLRYRLIPFGEGTIEVPGIDVVVAPRAAAAADDADPIPGGSLVGDWDDQPGPSSEIQRLRSDERAVRVAPVQTDAELAEGAMPRPPDDVMGFGWSWPSVVLLALFASALVAAGAATTKGWLDGRRVTAPRAAPAVTSEAARLAALAEIDRLLHAGPYAGSLERPLYQASSDVVRRYVERLDPSWGPGLTSTELMARFGEVERERASPARELSTAERVKFGRALNGEAAARDHLLSLRAWLSGSETRP